MIFKLITQIQQNICIILLLCVLIYLVHRLYWGYYIYSSVKKYYHNVFGEQQNIDPITQEKLIKYWNTKPYNDFFENAVSSMEQCKNETIIFTGLCQDHGEDIINEWMPKIDLLSSHFKDYRIIIVENDSNDDTREYLLKESERNSKFIVLCDENKPENTRTCKLGVRSIKDTNDKEGNLIKRIDVMGGLRQVYWHYILKNYGHYDYMCVLDWDLGGFLSVPGFFHGLYYTRFYTDATACNSFYEKNGKFFIYDTYPLLNHHRCDHISKHKKQEDQIINLNMRDKIFYNSAHPIQVESAFGGLSIYNIKNIKEKNPNYVNRYCPVECEHTTFNRNLEVYIDPWMTFFIKKNRH